MKLSRSLLLALACTAPLAALAQWQWVDNAGRKVFSDQPPPADIQPKNILRAPGVRGAPPAPVLEAVAAAAPAASGASAAAKAASAPKLSGKDKELEDKKKATEAADAEKKKAEDERVAKVKADNCARAKQGKADLDAGYRIARTNGKGEREVLDDAGRAAEAKRLQDIITAECKG